jgi:hypothetical protein
MDSSVLSDTNESTSVIWLFIKSVRECTSSNLKKEESLLYIIA